jgi:hypothetical protein
MNPHFVVMQLNVVTHAAAKRTGGVINNRESHGTS